LILLLLLLKPGISFSQADHNQFDANNQRHGPWKKYYEGTTQLRYEGQFEHGREVGTFKFYCEECKEQPMVIKDFSSDGTTADVKYFTISGKLVSQGKMKGKQRIGEWLYYHKNSREVMSRETYKNGKLEGKKLTYYPNGKLTEEISYDNGVMQGESLYYGPDGTLLKKLRYSNDELHGEAIYYDPSGNVNIMGYYKEGKKHGLWKYYKDGNVVLEETYPKPNGN
jgi:antitoxin component YwqK of YwqJK toxin-antitoxin module